MNNIDNEGKVLFQLLIIVNVVSIALISSFYSELDQFFPMDLTLTFMVPVYLISFILMIILGICYFKSEKELKKVEKAVKYIRKSDIEYDYIQKTDAGVFIIKDGERIKEL